MMRYKEKQRGTEGGNTTGIPTQLKRRLEESTSLKLDDVKVHYRSERPATLDALAYTQGTQVYLGPGQERHLPHELGHVVQQKLGMVRADSRHESGAPLNTDRALERQADRIGAGRERIAGRLLSRRSEPTVQRMSVLEGVTGGRPQIARYKRSGWKALQNLKRYLTEACIESVQMNDLTKLSKAISAVNVENVLAQMNNVTEGMGKFKYQSEFQGKLSQEMVTAGTVRDPVEKWMAVARELQGALEQCGGVIESIPEANRPAPELSVKELKGKGNYQREGAVDPYFNYKKEALYCIAHKATKLRNDADAGPHIALSVMGKAIYVASNSHYKPFKKIPAMTTKVLGERIQEAIETIRREEIGEIVRNGLVSGARFEEGVAGKEVSIEEIFEYIQQLKQYPIKVVDAPEYRSHAPGAASPIHGEMAIMDYLQQHDDGKALTAERERKLAEITPPQSGGAKRVIWIGGTRVDCEKCHEHFGEINTSTGLGQNYVVSSERQGPLFNGTEGGTRLSDKTGVPPRTTTRIVEEILPQGD
ncbi:MAG: DUF4157 domain-containing protein [bacterium]|nr:DUF4157 domain-containing protein [bacterium]MCM1374338.1 DUF4157 domain-containing protein [Muribaculum sp.]